MELYTKYSRPLKKKEKGGGKVVVERAGYIPPKARIEALINAGRRLVAARADQYHFEDGEEIDEDFVDPTVSPAFDEFAAKDAENYVKRSVNDRIKEAKKASLEKEKTVVDGDKVRDENGREDQNDKRSEKVDN